MKNNTPQLEDGYIRIAREIVKQLIKLHLSGNEWQIVWGVWDKTWGWHKKEDAISLTQFEKMTALSRPSVKEAIDKLVGKKVLVVRKEPFINVYRFNKVYSDWIVPKKVLVGFSVTTSREKGTRVVGKKEPKLVPKKEHTIDNKDTYTKDIYTKYTSNKLLGLFKNINPSYERLFANKTQRLTLDRLVKKYGEEKMFNLLTNLPTILAKPYAPRITTPYELEVKMGQLVQFLNQEKLKINKHSVKQL